MYTYNHHQRRRKQYLQRIQGEITKVSFNCVEHNSSSEYLACDFTDHYSLYLGHQIVWLRNELPARYEIRGLFQKSMKAKMSLMSLGDLYQCVIRVT